MSIYEFLKEQNAQEPAAGSRLPDSGDLHLRPGEAWVPGAFEGILLRTDSRIKQHVVVNYRIANRVKKQALRPKSSAGKGRRSGWEQDGPAAGSRLSRRRGQMAGWRLLGPIPP